MQYFASCRITRDRSIRKYEQEDRDVFRKTYSGMHSSPSLLFYSTSHPNSSDVTIHPFHEARRMSHRYRSKNPKRIFRSSFERNQSIKTESAAIPSYAGQVQGPRTPCKSSPRFRVPIPKLGTKRYAICIAVRHGRNGTKDACRQAVY